MELQLYWEIIRRRLWLIVVLLAVVGVTAALTPTPQPQYAAGMRFVVGIRPEASSGTFYTYDRHYTWLTAEYMVDDLAEVVKSEVFAQDVATASGLAVPTGAIQGATSAGKLHRILTISVVWSNPEELQRIADAVVEVLQNQGSHYFAQLSTDSAVVSLIDTPRVSVVGPSLRQRLDLPLRLFLALAAGIALTFLLDYLDGSIRHRKDAQSLGLPILAEVPARRGRLGGPWGNRTRP
ncbi:MAG: YveK family protein [Anaerolineae bacterium]